MYIAYAGRDSPARAEQASFSSSSSILVIRVGARPNLDFAVHASVYGKVFSPPPGLVVAVVVVLHDPTPSHYTSTPTVLLPETKICRGLV
jgi:hypothetical protein